jgi:hypothetical protein
LRHFPRKRKRGREGREKEERRKREGREKGERREREGREKGEKGGEYMIGIAFKTVEELGSLLLAVILHRWEVV